MVGGLPISSSIQYTLACFVITGVLKLSVATEMVLGYNDAYSSKLKTSYQNAPEYTFYKKNSLKNFLGKGHNPVLKLPRGEGYIPITLGTSLSADSGPGFSSSLCGNPSWQVNEEVNWLRIMKWISKLIPKTRWCISKWAIRDFQWKDGWWRERVTTEGGGKVRGARW